MRTHAVTRFARSTIAAASLILPALVLATPPIDQFGSLAHVCAGVSNGAGLPVDNINLAGLYLPDQSTCKEAFDPSMAKVKAKVTHSGARGTGSASAQEQPGGKLRVRASNNAVGDGGEQASAVAGFTDMLTVNAPGFEGQSGLIYYKVQVKGTLETHGPSGGAVLRILPLAIYSPLVWKDWSVATDIVTPDAFLAVDETAILASSMVFGVPFRLTTVAWATASIRSQNGTSHGTVAFDGKNAIRLKGIDHVVSYFGVPITDYTVTSQAGLPW